MDKTKQSWRKKYLVDWWKKPLVRLWKEYPGLVVFVVVGAGLSIAYLCLVMSGRCEYTLIGRIDEDPIRTAGMIFGTFLLLISMYLVTERICRIDTQIAETKKSNDLAKLHHGITMLHAGNSITQAGGVEYLHRLAEENKQQWEEVLRVFRDFLKHVPSLEKDGSRQAKDMILRKMFINEQSRETYPNEKIDLREADLPVAHLEEAHLEGAHLEGAHLEGAHLKGANLKGANLSEAHLKGANLKGANLSEARLKEAHLVGADLMKAHLEEAHLEEAHLEGAHLVGAHLVGAHLRGAHLEGAHLEGANLFRVNLSGAHLEGAYLHYATISEGKSKYTTDVVDTDDVIWVRRSMSDERFKWRGKPYDRLEMKEALESHLSQLQNELFRMAVQSVIDRLSDRWWPRSRPSPLRYVRLGG